MAIEMNKRTLIFAGVGVAVLAAAGVGAWLFLFDSDAPPPRAAAPKTAPAAKAPAGAPKAGDAAKTADAGKAAAGDAKQAAAPGAAPAPAATSAPAAGRPPVLGSPEQVTAAIVDASGVKTQYQAFARDTLLKAGADASQTKVVADMVERAFEPGKLSAELAAGLKASYDAERMARFQELLRQPIAVKMASLESRNASLETMQEQAENLRKNPPSTARSKLIQALDDVTHTTEVATDLGTAITRDLVDAMLADMQKAGKSVPKQARESVGSRLNTMRNQMPGQIRTAMLVMYRDATDQELADYVKLLDADTGRWGMGLIADAARPALTSRGSALGREYAQIAMSKRAGAMAKAPAAPAAEPAAAPAEKPAGRPAAAAPAEPVGYQRPANIRPLYTRYNDLISATVMNDGAAVKELLDDGKSPNVRQADGMTPLMIAVANGNADIAGTLLSRGADPNLRAAGGTTALSLAKRRGSAGAELVGMLQRSGAKE